MAHLPSTTALRAFEAAARHLSFTAAARELNQTQGAVSHQIRELEQRLQATLFRREGRGIRLTEAGGRYLPFARQALERLAAGAAVVRPDTLAHILTISVSPNFATKWLVPRLGGFLSGHGDIDLRISASMQHVTFTDDAIDLAVRHGDGNWPELHVERLCRETVFPVCSPHLPGAPELSEPSQLQRQTLLHDRDRERWADWLRRHDVVPDAAALSRGPIFNQTSLAIDAAVAGQGVALARSALSALDLAQGRLIRPMPHETAADFAYWIVCPRSRRDHPNVARLFAWLLQEAGRETPPAAASG